jgi:large subunit ribosomal protein L22
MRGSARKMRLVADLVRGKPVDEALDMLSVLPRGAATPVFKTLQSAAANALAVEGTAKLKSEDLRIKTIFVDGGPIMKRIRPMGMGRAYRLRKRLCHLTVVLEAEHEATPERPSARRRSARQTAKPAAKKTAKKRGKGTAKKTAPKAAKKTAAGKTAAKKKSGTAAKKAKGDR